MYDDTPDTLNDLPGGLLDLAARAFDAHAVGLYAVAGEELALAARTGQGSGEMLRRVPLKEAGFTAWVARERQPVLVNDLEPSQRIGCFDPAVGGKIRAFMAEPVLLPGRQGTGTSGVLCVASLRPHCFSPRDQQLLRGHARMLQGMYAAEAEAMLAGEDAARYRALAALRGLRTGGGDWKSYRTRFLALAAEATGMPHAALVVANEGGDGYSLEGWTRPVVIPPRRTLHLPMEAGLAGWALRNASPVYSGHGQHHERNHAGHGAGHGGASGSLLFGPEVDTPPFVSLACIPFAFHRAVRGGLCLCHTGHREMDEGWKQFARCVTEELGSRLETLYWRSRAARPEPGTERSGTSG